MNILLLPHECQGVKKNLELPLNKGLATFFSTGDKASCDFGGFHSVAV
jgi:hypothetical protein